MLFLAFIFINIVIHAIFTTDTFQEEESFVLVNMEEQSSTKNSPMHFMSTNFGGDCSNDVSNVSGDDPNQHILMAAGNWKGKGNQNDPLNVTCWMEPIEPSQSYVKLLAESISFPQTDPEYKLDTHPSTIRGKSSVNGVSEMQRDMPCNNQGISHRYKRIGSSIDMDAPKVRIIKVA